MARTSRPQRDTARAFGPKPPRPAPPVPDYRVTLPAGKTRGCAPQCSRASVRRPGFRVVETGVGGEPVRPIERRVETADQHGLVGLHPRKIMIPLVWVVCDRINLAGAVGIKEVIGDQVFFLEALCVAQCQRRIEQRTADWAPQIDDRVAVPQHFLRLRAHQRAHPFERGPRRVLVWRAF